jgi:pimeloyl-ACP methyl ester carboxylesterase
VIFRKASQINLQAAYAVIGQGPTVVKAPTGWITSNWTSPCRPGGHGWHAWRATTLVRYDCRGCGPSDRDAGDISMGALQMDLEAVVDAARLDRFAGSRRDAQASGTRLGAW